MWRSGAESVGAHDQLKSAALSVSPTDIEGTMMAMHQAITMSAEERQERASKLTDIVEREDVTQWLTSQISDLLSLN